MSRSDSVSPDSEVSVQPKPSGPTWVVGAVVVIIAFVLLAIVLRAAGEQTGQAGPEVQMTPIVATPALGTPQVGGLLVATPPPPQTATSTTVQEEVVTVQKGGAEPAQAIGPESESAAVWEPGQTVVVRAGRVQLHADADLDAMVLDSYAQGALFVIVEPSGDYESYPVERDGYRWYRLRAADGLVGWAVSDDLEP